MAVTTHAEGTQSCSAATEHTLNPTTPDTTPGAYQLMLDLNALTATQNLEIRLKAKTIAGGTQRVVWYDIATGVQGEEKIWVSPVIMLLNGWDMTIKSNSTPSIPWSIRKA